LIQKNEAKKIKTVPASNIFSFFCLDTKKRNKKKSRLCLLRSKN